MVGIGGNIARRLGWDQPPLVEEPVVEPHRAQRPQTIPQGAEFLLNPPERFEYPEWNIEYRLLQNNDHFVSYCATNGYHVDLVIFLKNRRTNTYLAIKDLLKGSNSKHHFEDANLPVASLLAETIISSAQRVHTPNGIWSLCKLYELTGIHPGGR